MFSVRERRSLPFIFYVLHTKSLVYIFTCILFEIQEFYDINILRDVFSHFVTSFHMIVCETVQYKGN